MESEAVGRIPNRRFNSMHRVDEPGIQFGPRDAHQTAGGIQPERTIIVLYGPVYGVTGQPIFRCEGGDTAIFDAAQAAVFLDCCPHRSIAIELKTRRPAPFLAHQRWYKRRGPYHP